jgi:hypothetical protein
MHKNSTRLSLLAAALVPISPLVADTPPSAEPPATVHDWVTAVNARIDAVLINKAQLDGTVTVAFRRGGDGLASEIEIRGARPAMAHAARRTLARLGQLPPLPRGIDPRQQIKLQLLFGAGDDRETFDDKRRAMLAAASERNGRIGDRRSAMVAGISRKP